MSGEFIPALRFKALTRFYDPVVRLTTRERSVKHALIESAHAPQGATVVDLGCGTGTLTVWLKQQYPSARVIGLDADPAILEFARAKADVAGVDIEFIESNASDLPFAAGTVDRIVSSLFFTTCNRTLRNACSPSPSAYSPIAANFTYRIGENRKTS